MKSEGWGGYWEKRGRKGRGACGWSYKRKNNKRKNATHKTEKNNKCSTNMNLTRRANRAINKEVQKISSKH